MSRHVSKRTRLILLAVGLVVAAFGFYADKATSFPAVLALMAPRYAGALRAMVKLEQQRSLAERDSDFHSLAHFVAAGMSDNTGRPPSPDRLDRFELGQASLVLGDTRVAEHVPFRIFVKSQSQPIEADLGLVKQAVNERGGAGLLRWSMLFFWVGLGFAALSALIDLR
jgi:hypothetical protein